MSTAEICVGEVCSTKTRGKRNTCSKEIENLVARKIAKASCLEIARCKSILLGDSMWLKTVGAGSQKKITVKIRYTVDVRSLGLSLLVAETKN